MKTWKSLWPKKKEDSSIEYIIIENGEEKKNENKDNIESESDKNADKSRKRKIKKRIKNKKISKELIKEIVEYVLIFLIALVVMLLLNKYIIINARIPSASMEDTVMTGDRLIGNRLAYKNDIPQRFDVIIFKFPDNESELYIKRIIGLPGETVTITGGKVYINDSTTPLDDSLPKKSLLQPVSDHIMFHQTATLSWATIETTPTIPVTGLYLCKSEQILGKAMFRYYPFNKISKVE